jgi:hypothetical protein
MGSVMGSAAIRRGFLRALPLTLTNSHAPTVPCSCHHPVLVKVINAIGRTALRNNYLRCLFIFISPLLVSALAGHLQVKININKHLEGLLRGTVLSITFIKYVQQDAEPQNKKLVKVVHQWPSYKSGFSIIPPQEYKKSIVMCLWMIKMRKIWNIAAD